MSAKNYLYDQLVKHMVFWGFIWGFRYFIENEHWMSKNATKTWIKASTNGAKKAKCKWKQKKQSTQNAVKYDGAYTKN